MRARNIGIALAVVVVLEVLLYTLWPRIDDNDAPPTLENQLAVVAAVLLFALPHVLAFLGRRERPAMLVVAGVLGIFLTALSVLGFSLIFFTIPLVFIPSAFYLAKGIVRRVKPSIATPILVVATILLACGAAWSLFLAEDPRCMTVVRKGGVQLFDEPASCNPNNSGRLGPEVVEWSGTSDTVVFHESIPSLVLSGAAIAFCLAGARQRRCRPDEVAHDTKATGDRMTDG